MLLKAITTGVRYTGQYSDAGPDAVRADRPGPARPVRREERVGDAPVEDRGRARRTRHRPAD